MTALIEQEGGEMSLYQKMADPIAAIEKMGEWFYRSGLFGNLTSPAGGCVIAMACMAENRTPFEISKRYHVIDNKLSMKAEAMLAEFNSRGGKHRIIQRDGDCVAVELTPHGGAPVEFRFTWEEAQAERYVYGKDGKTLKDNWSTPRRRMQMMWARVVSDAVRAVDPGVVVGTYTPEEIMDMIDSEPAPQRTQEEVVARREELQAIANNAAEDVVDVTPEPAPQPAEEAATEEVIEDEPAPQSCTNGQLKELLDMATECGIDKATLREKVCEATKVEDPKHMTFDQANELIERFRATIEKKRST